MGSAEGIDVSAFQTGMTTAELRGFSFAFTRVSDGTGLIDANLKRNWGTIASAGIHRGGYHELRGGNIGDGKAQADYFLAALKEDGGGWRPGDMMAVVASDYEGTLGAEVLSWCETVKAATAGKSPVLVYSDLSKLPQLADCTGYPLWVAWPSPVAPSAAQIAPWKMWHLWQWGTRSVGGGLGVVDADAFNGDPAEMTGWIGGYVNVKPPSPSFGTRYESDGTVSMNTYCAAMKVQVHQVLWATAAHRPHGYGPTEAAYFNGGEWENPMPKGTVVWSR